MRVSHHVGCCILLAALLSSATARSDEAPLWGAPPRPPPTLARRPLGPAVAVGGVSLVVLGVALGLKVAALGRASEVASLQLGPSACLVPGAHAARCAALQAAAQDRVTWNNASVVTFWGGGVFALMSVGLAVWALTPPRIPPLRLAPIVGTGRAGLAVGGAW